MMKQSANTRGRPFSGVHCVKCGSIDSHVIDSRNHEASNARRRRHQCNNCGYRYTTYEVPAEEYEKLQTIKMDVSQIDSVIAVLRMIKTQFRENGGNGHRQD